MLWMQQLQSLNWGQISLCAMTAYALGCIATGYYLVRGWTGRDIRELESGSVGARNVGRVLGRAGFFLTVAVDFAKGSIAVWLWYELKGNSLLAGIAMLAVVAGHIWPAQLRFHGGKGVATSLGALVVWNPHLALAFAAFFLAAFAMTRRTVLPGLFAFACLPIAAFWLTRDGLVLTIVMGLAAMVLFAHRRNIVEEIPTLAARRGVESKTEHSKL